MKRVDVNDKRAVQALLMRFKREEITIKQALEALGLNDDDAFAAVQEAHGFGYHLKDLLHDIGTLGLTTPVRGPKA